MTEFVDIAIIGAGPYGLSAAAHLKARGADIRIFGFPMQTWQEAMPAGMFLKSEGFASNLSDPGAELPLEKYCATQGIPYADTGVPVSAESFTAYGKAFQKRFLPDLVQEKIASLERAPEGFELRTESGNIISARRVIVASGIRSFDYIPPELADLPTEYLSHSVKFGSAAHLSGKEVLVVGAGASATDVAVLLKSSGAQVTIVTRREVLHFQSPLGERRLLQKIKAPMTGLGPGWKSMLCVKAPLVFHSMPESFRLDVVRRYLGPAPAWFTKQEIEGHVPFVLGASLVSAEILKGRVRLNLMTSDHRASSVAGDHIVAATGYHVDIDRLTFLGAGIRENLRRADRAPALSRNFESSIPGLYFIGTAAANSFGPMLRFVYGADYTARKLARHFKPSTRQVHQATYTGNDLTGAVDE